MAPGILSSVGVGVWGKAPEAFPDSNTTLDTCQSASYVMAGIFCNDSEIISPMFFLYVMANPTYYIQFSGFASVIS